ncbi:MAG: RuBisCO large subunit C-terminal-like domain-containing protein [Candidatus Aenigmatarchaeota archaeon]
MKEGFLAIGEELDWKNYIIEHFIFETKVDPSKAACELAKEHSTALWKRVGVDEDFRPEHGAKVLEVNLMDRYKGAKFEHPFTKKGVYNKVYVKIAHPVVNFGYKIPNLLTAVAGEGVFFTKGINSIKLMDLEFPESYLEHFPGPKFGVDGLRDMLDVKDRPFFTGVVKPNIGLNPKQFAEIAYEGLKGGLDIAKDDEMLADVQYSSLKERTIEMQKVVNRAEKETGDRKVFLANITDEVGNILDNHDMVTDLGCEAVMLNAMPVGLSTVKMLREHTEVPIFSHFDFIAPFTRSPYFGLSTAVVTKLQRMVGFDAIIMPGFGDRMITPSDEVRDNVGECLDPLGNLKPCLPIPGGSDWAGTLPGIYKELETVDFSLIPGRGVFGHPGGPKGGAKSVRQSWEAIESDTPLEEYAKDHKELRRALEYFGDK